MAERDWKQRWMDPTLLGRRWRWFVAGCVVYPLLIHLLTSSLVPAKVSSVRYLPFAVIGCFGLGTWYVLRWHRRTVNQAKAMDYRMCEFCGYDLRAIEEPGPCPECGRKFDLAALRLYWEKKFEGRE